MAKVQVAVGIETKDKTGDEALLETVVQAAVESGEDLGGVIEHFGECADGADDERDGHRGFKAFAADIAEDEEGRALGFCDELEEVATDFLGRTVGAGDGESGDWREGFGDKYALEFLGAFELLLDGPLTFVFVDGVTVDGVDDGEEEEGV